jgi:hypothetical protein
MTDVYTSDARGGESRAACHGDHGCETAGIGPLARPVQRHLRGCIRAPAIVRADDRFGVCVGVSLAIASATYEWPGRTGVARLLGDEPTREREPSQTIPLRGGERPLTFGIGRLPRSLAI